VFTRGGGNYPPVADKHRRQEVYDVQADGSRVLNQQETIAAREKQQQLKDRFREWIWQDPERGERLARDYNERFNSLRLRTFDGSHLTLPGMVRRHLRTGDLDAHQKDAIWRILQTGSTLLAHVVGAGKTWTMAAAAMEMRRMGLAKKPMIVVPNHLVEQCGGEFLKLYPQANILVIGKEDFGAGRRERAMARIATGNYDAIIVAHRSFEFLAVRDDLFERFINQQLAELEDSLRQAKQDSRGSRIVKELERAKKRLATKLKQRTDREHKDDAITFEEIGVDQLFVDEADVYKNLFYTTKMTRIAGLPNSDSNRAFDMFLKTRYVREAAGGRGVVFATGTRISNTLAEMYTMLRYLAPELHVQRGVDHFDPWAANFAEAVTALELAPDGSGYRWHTRFAQFINLPELLLMFRSVADVQTAEMLNLPRPAVATGKPQVISAPASQQLKDYVQTLVQRAKRLRGGGIRPNEDNMLKITGDGRKAALDMRLSILSPQHRLTASSHARLTASSHARLTAYMRSGKEPPRSFPPSSSSATSPRPIRNAQGLPLYAGSASRRLHTEGTNRLHPRCSHRSGQGRALQRRQCRARSHPYRLDRKDGGRNQCAAPPARAP
jgi:N12 class adenine-specific DNA methylase